MDDISGVENQCVLVTPEKMNNIFSGLREYTLHEDDDHLLDAAATTISVAYKEAGVVFNEKGFKDAINEFFNRQKGGMHSLRKHRSIVSLVPRNRAFNGKDFGAFLMLIVSIFFIYLSFVKLNQVCDDLTGTNLSEIQETVQDQFRTAIKSVKREEVSFIKYCFDIFLSMGSNIATQTNDLFTRSLQNVLTEAIPSFANLITETCGPSTQQRGFFETLNTLATGFETVAVAPSFASCSFQVTAIQTQALINNKKAAMDMLSLRLSTSQNVISWYISYALRLGTLSVSYLLYRLNDGFKKIENNNNSLRLTRGGRRKKTRKLKNKNKTKRKKYRNNTFRKSRVKS